MYIYIYICCLYICRAASRRCNSTARQLGNRATGIPVSQTNRASWEPASSQMAERFTDPPVDGVARRIPWPASRSKGFHALLQVPKPGRSTAHPTRPEAADVYGSVFSCASK